MLSRRTLLSTTLALAAAAPLTVRAEEAPKAIRIGYQKNGILLVAKTRKSLEQHFAPQGIAVEWVEFAFGPPLLEALNTGSIDFGATGDTPPIFAQAAQAELVYAAAQPAAGKGQALVVPKGVAVKSVADVKGLRIGVGKGSSAHNFLVAALQKAGLGWQDITPVYLAPADARAAFAGGSLDAWAIWDPYFAIAELEEGAQVLATSADVEPQNSFFLASKAFASEHPAALRSLVAALGDVGAWAEANKAEVAQLFADETGISLAAEQRSVDRATFRIGPLTEDIAAQQQKIADRFAALGLIPAPIAIRDIVWTGA
ncbi:aliphatic sulfonate ABC transporter substrate-binding protein [Mycobacterium sp. KBS0706]|uniref:aliphatic sulfonate ABC transporter substrate-binding protein n=1 Tax=Mycobacterium sp. KBS0706 TaxID=2578109 RepID=UPI00110FD531|nr:aliphatic sulfonate ABC transporter substrate-binding protein [Mycobacterium sp. KBS0706]TSD89627.1 aliphatic sulfonate ABC transporter substrate-binding protein [Mycobacterium sp. KBS0706]